MKILISALSISFLTIGCGAGALPNAAMLDRNVHEGRIQLHGDRADAMAEAATLMRRHCGAGYAIEAVGASGELRYRCDSRRDIYGELPPALAQNTRR